MSLLPGLSHALRNIFEQLHVRFLRQYLAALIALIALLCLIATPALAITYSDNGDGTVTDPATGLTWMRCSMGQTWTGSTCTGTASTYYWSQAKSLTATVSFAGQSDWRLPNIRELQSIVDLSVYNPSLDRVAFPNTPGTPGTPGTKYWSVSDVPRGAGDSGSVDANPNKWIVDFLEGLSVTMLSSNTTGSVGAVRLVRAGKLGGLLNPARPTTDYVDHGDSTVTHTPTGLMWSRCGEGQVWGMNPSGSALPTCNGGAFVFTWDEAKLLTSTLAGYNDWRMPTEDELLSLMDYSRYSGSINSTIFPNQFSMRYWSTSIRANSDSYPNEVSTVNFSNGSMGFSSKLISQSVRFVRVAHAPGASTATTTTTTPTTTTTISSTTTTTQSPANVSLNLAQGWNLLGNGFDNLLDVSSLFRDPLEVITVWKWDTTNLGWQFYAPSLDKAALQAYATSKGYGVLGVVNPGEGFWVNSKEIFAKPLPSGTAVAAISFQEGQPGALKQGWNLISIGNTRSPSGFNGDMGAAPPSAGVIPLNITTLWAWDNPLGKWYFYAPNIEAQGGTALTNYITSKSYLDFTANNKTLGPGVGFWVNKP